MGKIMNSEKGLSLIEVVASILLISIILLSFFGLFVQSKKTGVASEEIVDATYLAQIELENIYSVTENGDMDDLKDYLSAQNYSINTSLVSSANDKNCVQQTGDNERKTLADSSLSGYYKKSNEKYNYILKFKEVCDTQGLYIISISVHNVSTNTKSFMETAYFIGG